jgi:hypothetical protein
MIRFIFGVEYLIAFIALASLVFLNINTLVSSISLFAMLLSLGMFGWICFDEEW